MIADFVVEAKNPAQFLMEPDLTPEERGLFLTVLTKPEVLNRMCRLAIVCDLSGDPGKYFEETFMGPEPEDILDCILPYLSADLQEYWTRLRREKRGNFDFSMDRIFQEFRSSLTHTAIKDMVTGEVIPLRVSSKFGAAA